MIRWIVITVLALSVLFLAQPDQAQAVVADFLGHNHRQDGYLDFNNDGKTDVFRTTGSSWQVSYGGTSSWQTLRASSWQLENGLCFGNFVGDARTDVFLTWNGRWYVSDGGTSGFTHINSSGYNQSDLAFGDFNGDRKTDVFVANGSAWYVSYGGTSAWAHINGSDYKLSHLAIGDFNGDGKADIFRADGKAWYVSYGGTSLWTKINTSDLKLGNLIYGLFYKGDMGLGDFDGDGKTDVFTADDHWRVSYGGTSTWSTVKTWVFEEGPLYFADFDGNRRTDVFKKVFGPPGWMVWFNDPINWPSHFRAEIIYPSGDVENSLWSSANDLGDGWLWLDWFGYFNVNNDPWIFHQEHGFLYPFGTSTESIVFWDSAMNAFWWTSETQYPYVFRFSDGEWLWYQEGSSNPRWFVRLSDGGWESW